MQAVAGLDTRPVAQPSPHIVPLATAPKCSETPACFSPAKLARAFDITALHDRGMEGNGEFVAVIMSGKVSDADLQQWADTFGLTGVPPIERITVGSGPSEKESTSGPAVSEGTMDVESVQAIAPRASVLYFSSALVAFGDAVNAVVRDGRAHVATTAGGCDEMWLASDASRTPADARGEGRGRSRRERSCRRDNGVHVLALRLMIGVQRGNLSDFPFTVSVGARSPSAGRRQVRGEAAWGGVDEFGNRRRLNPLDERPTAEGPGVDNSFSNGSDSSRTSRPADPYTGWHIVVNGQGAPGGMSAARPSGRASLRSLADGRGRFQGSAS